MINKIILTQEERRVRHNEQGRKWRIANLGKARKNAREWVKRQLAKDSIVFRKQALERAKKYRLNHLKECRAKEKAKSQIYRLSHPEYLVNQREYRKNNPERFKKYYLKRKPRQKVYAREKLLQKYSLDSDNFNHLFTLQEGKCAICKNPFNGETPKIDHCHKDGKTRGLLCQRCNLILGYTEKQLSQNINILDEFAKYLKTHNCWEKH